MSIYKGSASTLLHSTGASNSMILKAIEFAVQAHAGQYRKITRIPYIFHPLQVADILTECRCNEEVITAGILHDTVEDAPVSLEEIRENFGNDVAALVEAASEPDKAVSWEERKHHTLSALKTAPMDVLLLSCADKLDNIRSIQKDSARLGELIWSQFNRGKEKQAWYYHNLASIFREKADGEPGNSLFESFSGDVHLVFPAREYAARQFV
ncbi:HD domain-containing protein [Syntrophus aciditrophicus]|uniref:GTP pyrophosphokinase / guanosine-3',5'-bis(Diphosphate) 3'-pyrophosphohydrolase n=1 Tax=Syntrophus aciditrophicus (strain SB) TaxID=56780 RepID=Q2LUB4_SYNAS|nr:HD domain-containing protein [Syntrophus aciditrophicus]ABC77677.1 GTP pyrophosphokinase / guanosine-3',5'-bis(diphosphate) 3'-pyrophosphohydrolase [Syntrophus aciditrophicus SB]